ncbi:alginate lyase family protein [Paenibacillus tritici]|uniref:Alginate lyase family protein n=1 Tax=Paenibacillus tritici TaxID=1873425 RepID=A0ABX2DRW9_9BACL|nr:alginate lyase family protein [Paenibacillus tritici]NQX47413.1 alginate lyase family protein [Paenibacillus tritici]
MKIGYKELRHNPKYTKPQMSDEAFLRTMLDLDQPELAGVAAQLNQGDIPGARDAYLEVIAAGNNGRYYFEVKDVPKLRVYAASRYSGEEEAQQDIAEADRIVEGDIPLFKGKRVVFRNGAYDWNSWLFDSSQYQLHLTRFVYVKRLARAYALTGDEKYAKCFNDMISHFIDDNPMPVEDTFRAEHSTWDPLSVGVRLFMLPEAFITFFGSPAFEPAVKLKLIKSFHQHGEYVRKYHASGGNHVCMQLRGLIQTALLLPELKDSAEWLDYGGRELPGYIRQNVYPDGVQFEGSPNYHLIVMRDLYELVTLFHKLGLDAGEYRELLEKMFVVTMHLLAPDGQLVKFGDTDVQVVSELHNIMSLGAYLYQRGDFKALGYERLPFSLLWRVGPDAAAQYDQLQAAMPAETAACFPVGGYVTSRQGWNHSDMYMAMRAGVGIGGHAHSDALSLVLYAGGRELLADSGMGLFEWNKERKYTVSTRAHNTVVVDGQDQHVRSFHWNTPPTASCRIWDTQFKEAYDYTFASQYGYTRYEDPVIHSRKVLFIKNSYWLIVDLFEAKGQHRYEQYFHLPPGIAGYDSISREVSTRLEEANLLLKHLPAGLADDQLTLEPGLIFKQGQYDESPVVKRSLTVTGSAAIVTLAVPFGAEKPQVSAERLPVRQNGELLSVQEATALRIVMEDRVDEICLFHKSVDVTSYLDHTGNIISEGLLPRKTEPEAVEFAGGLFNRDVIVIRDSKS